MFLVIDQDYRALLERVRVKTGHASADSLWHYIDIARKTEGSGCRLMTPLNEIAPTGTSSRSCVRFGEIWRVMRLAS